MDFKRICFLLVLVVSMYAVVVTAKRGRKRSSESSDESSSKSTKKSSKKCTEVEYGVWSPWSTWGSCTTSCLGGLKQRTRTCDHPTPSTFGRDCVGNNVETDTCNNIECLDVRIRSDAGGRLEVFYDGEWGTVCDDFFNFNNNGAKVVCRMLGQCTNNARVIQATSVIDGSGRIWLDSVQCVGTEQSIFDCPQNQVGDHNCNHNEDVGVAC